MTITDASARLAAAADASLSWHPDGPYSLRRTIGPLMRGVSDPSFISVGNDIWNACTTPDGPATLRFSPAGIAASSTTSEPTTTGQQAGGQQTTRQQTVGQRVDVQAWGLGATAALRGVPRLLGADDDWSGFDDPAFHETLPRLVQEARRRNLGLRLPASGRMVDQLVPIILEQKVTGLEAKRGYRYLMQRFGTPAPQAGAGAPAGLIVGPTAAQWLQIPSWEWHRAGVGPQRSGTIMRALRSAVAIERLAALPAIEAGRKLQTIPGIGVWTAAEVVQRTHGCPDSIAVGDYHLAAYVGAALTGQRTDDAGMVRLLEPWRGHRQRIVRLIQGTGYRKPTFGPRMTIQDHRAH